MQGNYSYSLCNALSLNCIQSVQVEIIHLFAGLLTECDRLFYLS